MIHPGAKILSMCGPVNLENKLFLANIQWWDKPGIDIPILIPLGRK